MYYGDASRGEFTLYSYLSRVGSAIVSVHANGDLNFGISFPLVGSVQKVPRVELFCFIVLIRRMAHLD